MGDSLSENELYIALSDIFVDKEVNYDDIASIAKSFPIEFVNTSLFTYVAPACYYNVKCPVPPVCYFFDRKELLNKINRIKERENSFYGRLTLSIFSFYLKLQFNKEWKTLKKLL